MDDSGIFSKMCIVEDKPQKIAEKIEDLMTLPFTSEIVEKRAMLFRKYYDNKKNGTKILALFNSLKK